MTLSQVYVTCQVNWHPLCITRVITKNIVESWTQDKPPRKACFHLAKHHTYSLRMVFSLFCVGMFSGLFANLPIKITREVVSPITVDLIYWLFLSTKPCDYAVEEIQVEL